MITPKLWPWWPRLSVGTNMLTRSGSTACLYTDLESEDLRRLLVNAAYWCVGLEDKIPARSNAELVGEFKPLPFGFGRYKKGVRPSDHALRTQQ